MANPGLTPNPNLNAVATATGYFTAAECEKIVALGAARAAGEATISGRGSEAPKPISAVRKTSITWLRREESTAELFNKIKRIAQDMNSKVYKFELTGFAEPIQFTRYETIGDYYTWHEDLGSGQQSLRKLSIVVQLSDPSTYRGCNLQVFSNGEPSDLSRAQGTVLIFPAWHLHRVTPLEEGVRYSLVTWIAGPPFR